MAGCRENDSERNKHFHYMTYMATPYHQKTCPGGHEIYNFGRPFLGHHYNTLSLSESCPGVEKMIFKEIMHFHYMTYMATLAHEPLLRGS